MDVDGEDESSFESPHLNSPSIIFNFTFYMDSLSNLIPGAALSIDIQGLQIVFLTIIIKFWFVLYNLLG